MFAINIKAWKCIFSWVYSLQKLLTGSNLFFFSRQFDFLSFIKAHEIQMAFCKNIAMTIIILITQHYYYDIAIIIIITTDCI